MQPLRGASRPCLRRWPAAYRQALLYEFARLKICPKITHILNDDGDHRSDDHSRRHDDDGHDDHNNHHRRSNHRHSNRHRRNTRLGRIYFHCLHYFHSYKSRAGEERVKY